MVAAPRDTRGGLESGSQPALLALLRDLTWALPFSASLAAYLLLLLRCPLLPGIDGPYYAVQVSHVLRHGCLKYPDPPLAFCAMAALAALLGDTFLAVKVTASVLAALSVIPAYYLMREVTDSRATAALSSLAYSLSFYVLRMLGDFMKNAAGLLWLNLGLWAVLKGLEGELRLRTAATLYASALLLSALTHILDFWTLLAYASLASLIYLATGPQSTRSLRMTGIVLGVGGAVTAALFLAPWLTGGDIMKVRSLLAELSAPSGAVHPARPPPTPVSAARVAAPVLLAPLAALAARGLRSPARSSIVLASSAMALLLNLAPLSPQLLFRLNLMSCVPLALMLSALAARLAPSERWATATLLVTLAVLAHLSVVGGYVPRPSIPPPAYEELKLVVSKASDAVWLASPRLRYWLETLTDDVVQHPWEAPPGVRVLLLVDRRSPPPPPWARLVYAGSFFRVYELRK